MLSQLLATCVIIAASCRAQDVLTCVKNGEVLNLATQPLPTDRPQVIAGKRGAKGEPGIGQKGAKGEAGISVKGVKGEAGIVDNSTWDAITSNFSATLVAKFCFLTFLKK